MQHHIGTDIIEIERVKEAIERYGERFLKRVYTPDELKLYGERAHSLAASFAAKEAGLKLVGTGWRGKIAWTDIEVTNNPVGQPEVTLSGEVKEIAGRLGIRQISLSITHTANFAIASAVALAGSDGK